MEMRGQTVALVVAAGIGSRAGGETPKQYRRIAGRPLLAHALAGLRHPRIDRIQAVIAEGHEAAYRDAVGNRPAMGSKRWPARATSPGC
jgi:2-C-methyl-D-erythritol 4-phosphate cytidylyltransferase / 2-C-methyl-D-erythritol 2,4-cyclodiphosphate synthase